MSPFRCSLALLLLAFGGASFLFGMRMKGEVRVREGRLWESRRQNRRLTTLAETVGRQKACLERRVALLRAGIEDRDRTIARLEGKARDLELELALARIDREDLARESRRLEAGMRELEGRVRAMAAAAIRARFAARGGDWLAALREAGSRLGGGVAPGKPRPAGGSPPGEVVRGPRKGALEPAAPWGERLASVARLLRSLVRWPEPWLRGVSALVAVAPNLAGMLHRGLPF